MDMKAIETERLECATHGEFFARAIVGRDGSPILRITHCGKCAQVEADQRQAEESAKEAKARQARIEARFAQSGIPSGFVKRTFDTFRAETPEQQAALDRCRRFAIEFPTALETGASLVMLGGIGTGKTHLAVAIAHQIMARAHTVMYSTAMELVARIRDTMRRDATVSTTDLVDMAGAVDLLVLDEFGVQGATEDVRAHLTNVLDRRYRNAKPTILISNMSGQEFADYVGDRVADRLRERSRAIQFNWESQRTKNRLAAGF
jgi:DNA replication protein DnaC